MLYLKMPLACLLILLYTGWNFLQSRRISTDTVKTFTGLYILAVAHVVFDAITLYQMHHFSAVPVTASNLCAAFSYLSIDWYVFFLSRYFLACIEQAAEIPSWVKRATLAPVILTSLLVLVLPVEYVVVGDGGYSTGPKIYALYVSVIFYLLLTLYYIARFWSVLNRDKRFAIFCSAVTFAAAALLQITLPEILISPMAISLATLILLTSNENPEEYIEKQTGIFNSYAFYTVTEDFFRLKKPFCILNIAIDELLIAGKIADRNFYYLLYRELDKHIYQKYKVNCYHVADNGIAVIISNIEAAPAIQAYLHDFLNNVRRTEKCTLSMNVQTELFRCPEDAASYLEVIQRISSFTIESIKTMAYRDLLTGAKNRNAFLRDIALLQENSTENYWYILLDANNLKVINDTYGHSYGDELLQTTVRILQNMKEEQLQVYRIGGDEFAFVWRAKPDKSIEDFLADISKEVKKCNENRYIKVDFALGYAPLQKDRPLADIMADADRMMYQNKRKMRTSHRQ